VPFQLSTITATLGTSAIEVTGYRLQVRGDRGDAVIYNLSPVTSA
jgi:hypothetical protein